MSRVSVSLATSFLSLKHARFAALSYGVVPRVRLSSIKPYQTAIIAYHGPSLQRGSRRASSPPQPESNPHHVVAPPRGEENAAAFFETNLLNAREVAEKLVNPDGTVTRRFLKGADLDRDAFTRTFRLAALRVPADACGACVARLQGHLLNWPRVKNVPRVEGDDGDAEIKALLFDDHTSSVGDAVYGAEECVGDVKKKQRGFAALRKLTRGVESELVDAVKARKGRGGERVRSKWEDAAVRVEVLESEGKEDEDKRDLEPREATRLLLLDERFKDKPKDALPQAVQVVLANNPGSELVRCQLTLTYDYWPMDEILKEVLPEGMTIPTAFESVGHIAHLNLRNEHAPYRHTIAQIVLEKNKPRIRTVVNKTDVIHNKYRTMQLELLAGNSSLVTTVVEHGLSFRLDLASVYWNSRLATERQRLIDTFDENDIVCDMFAGVGPIAVVAAKKVKFVYANDLNPTATSYMQDNLSLNKLAYKVEVSNEDARHFVCTLLARPVRFSQVVMNLPLDAAEFLDVFVHAFSRDEWDSRSLPHIHVYGFSKAKNPEADYSERIGDVLGDVPNPMHIHRVRLVAPGKYMLCASFRLPPQVAFPRKTTIREYA